MSGNSTKSTLIDWKPIGVLQVTKRDLYSELAMALQEAKNHTDDKVTLAEAKAEPEKITEEGSTDTKVESD